MRRNHVLPGWLIVIGLFTAYKYGKYKTEAKFYKRHRPAGKPATTECTAEAEDDDASDESVDETEEEVTECNTDDEAVDSKMDEVKGLMTELTESLERILLNGIKEEG